MKLNDMALVMKSSCGNVGKLVLVLWQEAPHETLGVLWKVRFQSPQTVALMQLQNGEVNRVGTSVDDEAIFPDAWLMKASDDALKSGFVKPLDIDFSCPPETPAEVIDAPLSWPNAWVASDPKA